MTNSTSPSRRGIALGVALIALGGLALAVQASGVEVGWPIWIIAPGVVLILGAVAVGGPGGSGMAAVGGILTMVGVVLAIQEAYDLYQTWAYAWALVAPGGVGLGLAVYGLLSGRRDELRGGLGALGVGIVLFLVGFLFFEGVLDLSNGRFGDLAEVVVPVLLVAIGVIVVAAAFVPGPWQASKAHGTAATGAAGPGAAAWAGTGPGEGAPAEAFAGAAAGAATGSAGSATAAERLAVPLEGAADAELLVTFGAGHLRLGAAAPGLLLDGTYIGGVRVDRAGGPGRARLAPPTMPAGWTWDRAPYDWTMGVTAEVPLRLRVETGAADAELDLRTLRLAELRLRTGASETRVLLPEAAGLTRVDAEGGAASLRFRVPPGVAARIRSSIALGSTDIDLVRFPRTPAGDAHESPDYATAANRVEIEVRGGVGSVSVR